MNKLSQLLKLQLAVYGNTPMYVGEPKLDNGLIDEPKGFSPTDKQKCQPKEQHEFIIKGVKIMAASRKDAIKKYKHLKK